jgi:hypothetical protein
MEEKLVMESGKVFLLQIGDIPFIPGREIDNIQTMLVPLEGMIMYSVQI